MKRAALSWMVFVFVALLAINAEAFTATFDEAALTSGTNINTFYSAQGLTFGCFSSTGANTPTNQCTGAATGGNAFAVASPGAQSAPNVIGLSPTGLPFIDERFGFYRVSFPSPVGFVSVDAAPVLPPEFLGTTSNHPFLEAFDSSGHLLATAEWSGDVTTEVYHTLEITRVTDDIKFVAFSSFHFSGFPVYGLFDNFDPLPASAGGNVEFHGDLGPVAGGISTHGLIPPTAVPVAPSLLLLGAGIGVVGCTRWLFDRR